MNLSLPSGSFLFLFCAVHFFFFFSDPTRSFRLSSGVKSPPGSVKDSPCKTARTRPASAASSSKKVQDRWEAVIEFLNLHTNNKLRRLSNLQHSCVTVFQISLPTYTLLTNQIMCGSLLISRWLTADFVSKFKSKLFPPQTSCFKSKRGARAQETFN